MTEQGKRSGGFGDPAGSPPPPYYTAEDDPFALTPDGSLVASIFLLHGLPGWMALADNPRLGTEEARRLKLIDEMRKLAGQRVLQLLQHEDLPRDIQRAFSNNQNEVIVNTLMRRVLARAFPGQAMRPGEQPPEMEAVPAAVQKAAMAALTTAHERYAAVNGFRDTLRRRGLLVTSALAINYLDEKSPKSGRLAAGGLAVLLGGAGVGAVPIFMGLGGAAGLGGGAIYTSILSSFGGGAVAAGGGGMAMGMTVLTGLTGVGAVLAAAGATYLGVKAYQAATRAKNLSAAFELTGLPL